LEQSCSHNKAVRACLHKACGVLGLDPTVNRDDCPMIFQQPCGFDPFQRAWLHGLSPEARVHPQKQKQVKIPDARGCIIKRVVWIQAQSNFQALRTDPFEGSGRVCECVPLNNDHICMQWGKVEQDIIWIIKFKVRVKWQS
jgi:hypothetical protein